MFLWVWGSEGEDSRVEEVVGTEEVVGAKDALRGDKLRRRLHRLPSISKRSINLCSARPKSADNFFLIFLPLHANYEWIFRFPFWRIFFPPI